MLPKSRSEALRTGSSTYDTGRPCTNNHFSYRYTKSGTCSQCVNGVRPAKSLAARIAQLKADIDEKTKLVAQLEADDIVIKQRQVEVEAKRKTFANVTVPKRRKASLRDFKPINITIHLDDVPMAKALLTAHIMTAGHNDVTIDLVWPKGPPKHGVLYKVLCPDQFADDMFNWARDRYASRSKLADEVKIVPPVSKKDERASAAFDDMLYGEDISS